MTSGSRQRQNRATLMVTVLSLTVALAVSAGERVNPMDQEPESSFFGAPFWDLTSHSKHIYDLPADLGIEAVINRPEEDWGQSEAIAVKMDFGGARVWTKGTIELPNRTPGSDAPSKEWVVFAPIAATLNVDFFIVQNGTVVEHQTLHRTDPFSKRAIDVIGMSFPVPTHLGGQLDYYLGIDPSTFSQVKFQLYERAALERQDRSIRIVVIALLASIATLAIYNLFVFFSVRERSYLYYALFTTTGGLIIAASTNLDQVYLWPDSSGLFLKRSWVEVGAHIVFASLFAIRFLSLQTQFPVLMRLLLIPAVLGITLIATALAGYLKVSLVLIQIAAAIQYPVLMASCYFAWRAGNHTAIYYLASWILYVCSANYMILAADGYVSAVFPSGLPLAFGMVGEDLILSMALASRINSLRLEKAHLTVELSRSHADLEVKISERTAELVEVQQEFVSAAREAGKAEIATGVLHNIGNALNSIVTQHAILADSLENPKLSGFEKASGLMTEHQENLGAFLSTDPVGQKLPEYLVLLASRQQAENDARLRDLSRLGNAIDHICQIVNAHQEYAKTGGTRERIAVSRCLELAIEICGASRPWGEAELIHDYEIDPEIHVDSHQLCQVLVNLIKNGREACDEVPDRPARVTLRTEPCGEGRVRISISDNGEGIAPDRIKAIFQYGVTTKPEGHGFGLHSSANTIVKLKGSIGVESEGEDRGATFWVELPYDRSADS